MTRPDITIAMPVLNGARFLPTQLDSLARQSHLPTRVIVSDDGSSDHSRDLVRDFAPRAPFEVRLIDGPRAGYAQNIQALLRLAPETEALAFCDQDDVWMPDKLHMACSVLHPQTGPALHVGARIVTGSDLTPGRTLYPPPRAGFGNALVQNIAPANATTLNPAAVRMVQHHLLRHPPPFPDWWIYALVIGAGGKVLQDRRAGLLYRQHGRNLLGAAYGLQATRMRLRKLFDGSYRTWLLAQSTALDQSRAALTPQARQHLARFRAALAQGRIRPGGLGVIRYGRGQQALLHAAAMFGRL